MSDAPLKPCPFCGKMPKTHLFPDEYGGMQIDCITANCPASPITTGNSMMDPLIAWNAWNTRADLATPDPMDDPRVKALVEAATEFAKCVMQGHDLGWALVNLDATLAAMKGEQA